MKTDEASALVTRLFDGWPLSRYRDLTATQVLYAERLLRYEHAPGLRAIDRALDQFQRLPTIAELLELVHEEARDAQLEAETAEQRRRALEHRARQGGANGHGA